jgi:hypothetical protein
LHIVHTLGTALVVVGSGLLAAKRARLLLLPISAVGTMTLTLYSSHIVMEAADLLDEYRSVVSLAVQVGLFIGFAVLWRWSVGKGPLEGLVAFVTNWVRRGLTPSRSRGFRRKGDPEEKPAPSRGRSPRRSAVSGQD